MPESTPIFSEDLTAQAGLELLATTASLGSSTGSSAMPAGLGRAGLASKGMMARPGPYNPTSAIPRRLVKKILDMDFIADLEIADHDEGQGEPRPGSLARLPITNISQWVELFSIMAAINDMLPRKGPRIVFLPGLNCLGRNKLRGQTVGNL